MDISYTDGRTVLNAVVQIWDDYSVERAGFYRAFWCDSADSSTGSPVIGYCSPGGTHRTIKAAVAHVLRRYPGTECYRNGRKLA